MDRLSAMRALVRVIDTGSFSAAARQLRIGQPAVSKSIAQLEAALGVRLVSRTTRGLSPTDAGQRFYERARRAVDEADEAELAAKDAGATLGGRLRVSIAVTFGRMYIVPRLPIFMAAHPDLEIDLIMDDRPTDIIEEGVDLAVRLGPQPDSSLSGRIIASRRRLVVGTPDYFARAGVPFHPSDLKAHEAVTLVIGDSRNEWTFTRGSERVTVALNGRLRVTAGEGMREAVLAGIGLTVGAEWAFGQELASGALKAVLTDWTLPRSDVWAVLPSGRQPSARARAFAAFVESQLAA